jgi:hypothetical protein
MGAASPSGCLQHPSLLLQLVLLACAGCTLARGSDSVNGAAAQHAWQLTLPTTTAARSLQGEQQEAWCAVTGC